MSLVSKYFTQPAADVLSFDVRANVHRLQSTDEQVIYGYASVRTYNITN